MDKVYKTDIPKYQNVLEDFKKGFSRIDSKTDWVRLRIDPLLDHVRRLEKILKSPHFSREKTRLRKGVAMFHSDLVHLRENIRILKAILAGEKKG